MIIVMQKDAQAQDIQRVVEQIRAKGLSEHISYGEECTLVGAVGDERVFDLAQMERLPKVQKAIRIVHDWRLVSRETQPVDTVVTVRGVRFGGTFQNIYADQTGEAVYLDPFFVSPNPYVMADKMHINQVQQQIQAHHQAGRVVLVRIRDSQQIEAMLSAEADMMVLGGELMDNRSMLQEMGRLNTPVLVCKNKHHTVRDWLLAAEQVVLQGNRHVLLGEAGTINLHGEPLRLDVESIVQAKKLCHLPILADISRLSHRYMDTETLLKLAKAAGADGVIM